MESSNNIMPPNLKQKVALYISARGLVNLDVMSKSDPQIEVFLKDKNTNWTLVGKTERINNNLNPDFSNFIECDYYFEREQFVKFMAYDIDDNKGHKEFIGKVETTIGKICGALKQTFVSELKDDKHAKSRGKLIVRLDSINSSNDEARIKLSANLVSLSSMCCSAVNDPYFIISRARSQDNKEEFVRIFKGDVKLSNINPVWNPIKLKVSQICNGDLDLPIRFSVYSQIENGNDLFYGDADTTVNKLKSGDKRLNLTKKGKNGGVLIIDQFVVIEMPNFMDYLRSGWAVNMSFAIDFTASNGEQSQSNSLHYQNPQSGVMNQYESAIWAVGRVVEPYALNCQFATFGFGGVPRFLGSTSVSHCFNLNGQPNPQIIGLQNVFNAYKVAVNNTSLNGPTYMAPILKALLGYVQQCIQFQMYHCMVVLTDGDILDMSDTTEMIVQLSAYPVSIIIIGVGEDSFEKMKYLDSDDKILQGKSGKAVRDIVQFVKFQDYKTQDIAVLAEEVLKEMPDQIVGYMLMKSIKPQKLEWASVDHAVLSHNEQVLVETQEQLPQ